MASVSHRRGERRARLASCSAEEAQEEMLSFGLLLQGWSSRAWWGWPAPKSRAAGPQHQRL